MLSLSARSLFLCVETRIRATSQSMEDPSSKEEMSKVLEVLEALKQASQELQTHPSPGNGQSNTLAIKALLELETESDALLSKDPHLCTLSQHLSNLKSLVDTLQNSHGLINFLTRRVSTHSISRVAGSIETEIQAWIDRETVEKLLHFLKFPADNEEELVGLLGQLEKRTSQGFDPELQDLVLKSKVLSYLERILCDNSFSQSFREQCAFVVASLIQFNRNVFAGQVLMGPLVHALLSMASRKAMEVLCLFIKSIKSPLVDEIESNGGIPIIICFMDYKDLQIRVLAMDTILEIGYFGRKEAIDAMLKEGLVQKLVELQRSELGGDLIDMGISDEKENRDGEGNRESIVRETREKRLILESRPFASCVARFAVQLEVGEGLRQREKRAFKQEILE
ncbi:hypothetical protein K2173_021213 [Erythroxylum novogranatense]|uniref:Uncharacterized protein n=1 Tax=Erythroxylum novogranatense TaxID=1862640 RepID=A0AAV8TR04_9ROSI|nr:hypothetical protein K2173_021213 [Erythroxylum novogranatense]